MTIYGKTRELLGMYSEGAMMRLLLDNSQTYFFYPIWEDAPEAIAEAPSCVIESPDGNGDIVTYANGKEYRSGGLIVTYTKDDMIFVSQKRQMEAPATQIGTGEPKKTGKEKGKNTLWAMTVKQDVAARWIQARNANPNVRYRDVYTAEKENKTKPLPPAIKTENDFIDCLGAARKAKMIPPLKTKRRKSAGKCCQ